MPRQLTRLWWRLLGLALGAVLGAATFGLGFGLGMTRGNAMSDPGVATLLAERSSAVAELATLREELSKLRQEASVLERSRQIERETNKALQIQLKDAQNERLSLIREGTYLKRLIREGGKGAVRVHDLVLLAGERPQSIRYSFTVSQLVPDFGETKGRVTLRVNGTQGGKNLELGLERLARADPKELSMRFDHFQAFQGELTLPDGFEPRLLTVIISPEGDQLAGTSESFPWILEGP